MEKIALIGGGGHARVLIDLIRTSGEYEIVGILDRQLKFGIQVMGITVLGNDDGLLELYGNGIKNACIAVGSVRDNTKRKDLYEKVKQKGFNMPSLIHPNSIVSKNIKLSEGVQIMVGAIIQTGCMIGKNTIINTGAVVEHDCTVGNHVQVCPGAVISGGCSISDGAFIGVGATLIEGINVGRTSIVAAGAVVINDVPENTTVRGVPAK